MCWRYPKDFVQIEGPEFSSPLHVFQLVGQSFGGAQRSERALGESGCNDDKGGEGIRPYPILEVDGMEHRISAASHEMRVAVCMQPVCELRRWGI